MPDDKGNLIVGAPPVPGSAGASAGVSAGSRVLSVGSTPTTGLTAFDVVSLVPPTSKTVSFTLRTPEGEERTVELRRAVEEVKDPVKFEVKEVKGRRVG